MVPEIVVSAGPVPVSVVPEMVPLDAPLQVGMESPLLVPVHDVPNSDTVNVNVPPEQGKKEYVPLNVSPAGQSGIGISVRFPRFQSSAPTEVPSRRPSRCRRRYRRPLERALHGRRAQIRHLELRERAGSEPVGHRLVARTGSPPRRPRWVSCRSLSMKSSCRVTPRYQDVRVRFRSISTLRPLRP